MNLFAELKRRNVIRVGIAYLFAAYLMLQFASTFTPILGLPGWVPRLVFLLLLIGLVPTVIAAWALELTPDGIKLERDVDRSKPQTAKSGRMLNYFIIGMLVLVIVFLVIERLFIAGRGEAPASTATIIMAEPNKSVAVLPFVDLSQNHDQEWFADGLAEEILNALARTPDLMVSSRTSTFAYKEKDQDVSTIAAELGVANVLEGSIRAAGDRIRVTAQLIRAEDNFHLWSQTYDRNVIDVIGIQEDVAIMIAHALETTLDPKALEDMMRVGTRSVSAYQAYIRGIALRGRALRTGSSTDYLDAYEQFESAREIDAGFSAAHRAAAYYWKVQLNPTRSRGGQPDITPQVMLDNFLERINLAIKSAKDSTERAGSGAQKAVVELRLRTAIRRFDTYLDARPNDYRTWHQLLIVAQLATDQDASEKALAVLKAGGGVDRFAATTYLSTAYRFGKASAAADYGLEALKRWPNDSSIAYQTHRSLLWAGRFAEGAELIARMNNASAANPVVNARQVCAEGRRDDAMKILETVRSEGGRSVATEWTILMLLGEHQQASEVLRAHDPDAVPYQLASWLIYHQFDPEPFPSLINMLERENVSRPPAVDMPFACPT